MKLAIFVTFALLLLVGCNNSTPTAMNQQQSATKPEQVDPLIEGIRGATLAKLDDSVTIGDALEHFAGFTRVYWDRVTDKQNRQVVRFHGLTHDQFSKCKVLINPEVNKYNYGPTGSCVVDGEAVVIFYISKADQKQADKFGFKLVSAGVQAKGVMDSGKTYEGQLENIELVSVLYDGGIDYLGSVRALAPTMLVEDDSRLMPGEMLASTATHDESKGSGGCRDPRQDNPAMRQIDALKIMQQCAAQQKQPTPAEDEADCPRPRRDDPDVDQAAADEMYNECIDKLKKGAK